MGKSLYPPGATFCRHCGYCLHALTVNRCPECGHEFDPGNPKTFRARPRRTWPRRLVLWGGIPLLVLAVGYAGLLGWLYMGWKAEAPARDLPRWAAEEEKADPSVGFRIPSDVKTEPLLPAGWRWMILPACRPWMERVREINLHIERRPADLAECLSACRQIRKLTLHKVPLEGRDVTAISHLPELTELYLWHVLGGSVLDDQALWALAALRNLQILYLEFTRITDGGLESLTNLPGLRELGLYNSPALTDGGVEAICRCKGLKALYLYRASLSQTGIGRLKVGLPGCNVTVWPLPSAPPSGPAALPDGP